MDMRRLKNPWDLSKSVRNNPSSWFLSLKVWKSPKGEQALNSQTSQQDCLAGNLTCHCDFHFSSIPLRSYRISIQSLDSFKVSEQNFSDRMVSMSPSTWLDWHLAGTLALLHSHTCTGTSRTLHCPLWPLARILVCQNINKVYRH